MNKFLIWCKQNIYFIVGGAALIATSLTALVVGLNTYTNAEKFIISSVSAKHKKAEFGDRILQSLGETEVKKFQDHNISSSSSKPHINAMIQEYRQQADLFVLPKSYIFEDKGIYFTSIGVQQQQNLLASTGLDLHFTLATGNRAAGITIYEPNNQSYNNQFSKIYEWISFNGENEEYSLCINTYVRMNKRSYKDIYNPIKFLLTLK